MPLGDRTPCVRYNVFWGIIEEVNIIYHNVGKEKYKIHRIWEVNWIHIVGPKNKLWFHCVAVLLDIY